MVKTQCCVAKCSKSNVVQHLVLTFLLQNSWFWPLYCTTFDFDLSDTQHFDLFTTQTLGFDRVTTQLLVSTNVLHIRVSARKTCTIRTALSICVRQAPVHLLKLPLSVSNAFWAKFLRHHHRSDERWKNPNWRTSKNRVPTGKMRMYHPALNSTKSKVMQVT